MIKCSVLFHSCRHSPGETLSKFPGNIKGKVIQLPFFTFFTFFFPIWCCQRKLTNNLSSSLYEHKMRPSFYQNWWAAPALPLGVLHCNLTWLILCGRQNSWEEIKSRVSPLVSHIESWFWEPEFRWSGVESSTFFSKIRLAGGCFKKKLKLKEEESTLKV